MSQTLERETIVKIINILTPYVSVNYENLLAALFASDIDFATLKTAVAAQSHVGHSALVTLVEHGLTKQLDFIHPSWTQQTIIQIEKKISNSGNTTWKCELKGREKPLYIRQTNKALFTEHYPDIEQLAFDFPVSAEITVYTKPDGDFLSLEKVIAGGHFGYKAARATAEDVRKATACYKIRDLLPAAYVDFETTGIDESAEIVQFGIASHDYGILETFTDFIKPEEPERLLIVGKNGKCAQDIHGISAESLQTAKPFEDHYQTLKTHIHGKTVVTYGDFDLRILNQVCARHELEPITPSRHINLMTIYAEYHGEPGFRAGDFKWQSLENAYEQMTGKALTDAHSALADAEAMRLIVSLMTPEEL